MDPATLIDGDLFLAFANGQFPAAREVHVPRIGTGNDLSPPWDGRLVLMWGPPGTGKTTLLRSLARHWQRWCETVYVSDPDRLFGDPGYLNALVLDEQDGPVDGAPSWTLLVLEDCDELIRPDATNASHPRHTGRSIPLGMLAPIATPDGPLRP